MRRLLVLALLTAGCGGGSPAEPTAPAPPVDARQFCADLTNEYRASIGKSALRRSATLEDYADRAAAYDSTRPAIIHAYFNGPGRGVARAENQMWEPAQAGIEGAIRGGMRGMWAEGPGGGHYENLIGPYSTIGCGHVVAGRTIIVVQAFR